MSEIVCAVILLREDGAALLQHRDDKPSLRHAGMWVPPGGHADPGEALDVCAKRELLEETGYVCADLHWLTTFEDRQDGWPPYALTVFWARYEENRPLRCHEGQALEFIERSRTSAYPIPPYLVAIWDQALLASRTRGRTNS